MRGRTRRLLVLALALLVVAGFVVVDAVTLTKARPSFVHETRDVENLIKSTTTTTVAPRGTISGQGPVSTSSTSSTPGTTSTSGTSATTVSP